MTENYSAQNASSASWESLHYAMVFNSCIVFGHWVHCFSVTWSCLTLCYPLDCSTPGFPVHHKLSELTQTHVCSVGNAIQPFHSLSFPSLTFNLFQIQGLFPVSQFFASGGQGIGALASVLPMNIQDWFPLGMTGLISLQSQGLSRVFSNTTVQKHQFFSVHP